MKTGIRIPAEPSIESKDVRILIPRSTMGISYTNTEKENFTLDFTPPILILGYDEIPLKINYTGANLCTIEFEVYSPNGRFQTLYVDLHYFINGVWKVVPMEAAVNRCYVFGCVHYIAELSIVPSNDRLYLSYFFVASDKLNNAITTPEQWVIVDLLGSTKTTDLAVYSSLGIFFGIIAIIAFKKNKKYS
jgi:hypothetical protein